MQGNLNILCGDWVDVLKTLPSESVQMCCTSPPYWGLRDYKMPSQIGLEKSPGLYVEKMVEGFREVRRVLREDGTLWLNLGDTYAGGGNGGGGSFATHAIHGADKNEAARKGECRSPSGYKPKDLIGIPWMVAFALRADGWYLRCDIIWSKPNPMPESVTDRPTKAHEYIFLLTKSARYYYNHEAIKEQPSPELIEQIEDGYNGKALKDYLGSSVQDARATKSRIINGYRNRIDTQRGHSRHHAGFNDKWDTLTTAEQALCGRNKRDVWTVPEDEVDQFLKWKAEHDRNKRSVWTVAPANYPEAHFATFPPNLIKPCILAGSMPGDTVLDPFGGSGTTGQVALELGRKAILIELNPEYIELIKQRCNITPGLPLA